jgi:hypothetical protein
MTDQRTELREALAKLRALKPKNMIEILAVKSQIAKVKGALKFLDRREVVPAAYLNDEYAERAKRRAMRWFKNKALTHDLPTHIARKGDMI